MAVSISGTPTTGSNSGSASNPVLNVPAGAVAGDEYVVSIQFYNTAGPITPAAGFTQAFAAASGSTVIYTFRRTYTGTEGATFTFIPTTQRPWVGICAIVTGGVYVTGNAAAQTNGFLSGGVNSAGTTGSVTRTAANQLVLAFCGTQTDIGAITASITDPAGTTRSVVVDSGQGAAMSLAYITEASAGSTNYSYGSSWSLGTNCWTSGAALVYTNPPPAITSQPTQQSAVSGSTATFSVTATGTGSLTYLWYKNGVTTGTTTSSYTTPTLANADNGNTYYCAVTDSNGTTNTATVYLFIIGESSGDGDKINSAWFCR